MKRIVFLGMFVALLMVFGCAKPNPEDVAKDYVKKQFDPDLGVTLKTSDLAYDVLEKDENKATIKVHGNIYYEESIKLVKVDGKWTIDTGKPQKAAKPAPAAPASTH